MKDFPKRAPIIVHLALLARLEHFLFSVKYPFLCNPEIVVFHTKESFVAPIGLRTAHFRIVLS